MHGAMAFTDLRAERLMKQFPTRLVASAVHFLSLMIS